MSTGAGSTAASQVISVADAHTGTTMLSYKQTNSPLHGVCATKSYVFAAQYQKAQINLYAHGKEGVVQKILLPERPRCIAVSPCGTYLAMGSEQGRLLIWELSSGSLLVAIDAHYQEISSLGFSQDSAYVITGSSDSRVLVWSMLDFVDTETNFDEIKPVHSWTHHSLSVTAVKVGYGRGVEARVYTASLDGTVRVWDLATGQLLTTFVASDKIRSIAVDPLERAVYAGLESGAIAIVDLYQKQASTGVLGAVGGAGQVVTLSDKSSRVLDGQHNAGVTAVELSYDGNLLFSGDAAGRIFAWDLATGQVLREHKRHAGPICSIVAVARPKGDDQSKKTNNKVDGLPAVPPFKRIFDADDKRNHDFWMTIPETLPAGDGVPGSESIVREMSIQGDEILGEGTESGLQSKVQELESDLARLFKNYNNLKGVHEELWRLHVSKRKRDA